jgi:hypothetical protein
MSITNFRPPWSTIKTVAFSLIPVILLTFLAEGGARLFKRQEMHRPVYWAHKDRLTNPAYTTKEWFCEAFLIESFIQPGGWFTPPGTRLIFPKDFSGHWFVVEDGARRTISAAEMSEPHEHWFLLGGSTTYCSEVPDGLTWPSQLQLILARNNVEKRIQVRNYACYYGQLSSRSGKARI